MNRISVFAIIFTLFIPLGSYAQYASSSKTPKKAGDLIESTSYNDHKRGAPRMLQYLPSGEEFVCVNGRTFQVPRGKAVEVPLPVYEVLENARRQLELAQKLEDEWSAD